MSLSVVGEEMRSRPSLGLGQASELPELSGGESAVGCRGGMSLPRYAQSTMDPNEKIEVGGGCFVPDWSIPR
ncbi:hypothetical protein HYQ46_003088 [Verticillium longisporum]|nr:hypothetical protein HYQ46_003088 [Verticillium longisporum]